MGKSATVAAVQQQHKMRVQNGTAYALRERSAGRVRKNKMIKWRRERSKLKGMINLKK